MKQCWIQRVGVAVLGMLCVVGYAMPKMPPAMVDTAEATQQQWRDKISATGVLAASQGVMLRAETGGRLTELLVKSGQQVTKGQRLFQINPDVLRARVAQQSAQLPLNQQNFDRQQTLLKKGVASQAEVDRARASLQANKAALAEAQAMLAQTEVRAPFAGRVGLKQVSVGDFIQPGQDLISIQSLSDLYIEFKVSAKNVHQLAVGESVLFTLDGAPKKTYQGKIYALESSVDAQTRSLGVRARVLGAYANLVPGTFVNVKVLVGTKKTVVTIPSTAIVYDAAGDFVYKVVSGRAKKVVIKIGQQRGDNVSVLSGVQVGEQVITAGQVKLFDGAAVVDKQAMMANPAHSTT